MAFENLQFQFNLRQIVPVNAQQKHHPKRTPQRQLIHCFFLYVHREYISFQNFGPLK